MNDGIVEYFRRSDMMNMSITECLEILYSINEDYNDWSYTYYEDLKYIKMNSLSNKKRIDFLENAIDQNQSVSEYLKIITNG